MLQIKNISKQYKTGDLVQVALDDVSLSFRDNEFVSILGPSGSGKTTLLNIVGGLDRYDSGDLIINNVSTKRYKDRDWDSYRNHTVGFVFQSYNLIPHQTVLANVELALTIGGISKRERKRRALKALEDVGLKEQAHKKPNQMSGGQMQRVAIARALVNNPDILLADEPTGALDTVTSVQVMELLKKVANDRLVIMVTHNPELAEEYSTRIVRLKDGKITGDTNPFEPKISRLEKPKHKNLGKASMTLGTAFSLSLNNLLTKKGRTILTSFAGSIGIIGIALILSLSTGFQNYIDKIQEDTLTSYPLTIESETADMSSLMLGNSTDEEEEAEKKKEQKVKEQQNVADLFGTVGRNDLKTFKDHLEKNQDKVDEMVSLTRYSYAVQPNIYTRDVNDELILLNPSNFIASLMGSSSSLMSGGITIFAEMVDDEKMLDDQYDIIKGKLPDSYNEIAIVLPNEYEISDMLLYGLGVRDQGELEDMIGKIIDGEKITDRNEPLEFTHEELMNLEFKLVDPSDRYKYNSKYDIYEDMSDDEAFMDEVYDNSVDIKVVGIVKPTTSTGNAMMSSGVLYSKKMTEYIIDTASKSEIVKKQLANEDVNVFSGKDFDDEEKDSGLKFEDMISIDEDLMAEAFGGNMDENTIKDITTTYINEISKMITVDTTTAEKDFIDTLSSFATEMLTDYAKEHSTFGVTTIKPAEVDGVVNAFMTKASTKQKLADLEKKYGMPQDILAQTYTQLLTGFVQAMMMPIGAMPMPTSTAGMENVMSNTVMENTVGGTGSIPGAGMGGNNMPSTETAFIYTKDSVSTMVGYFVAQDMIKQTAAQFGASMVEVSMQKGILTKVGELTGELMETVAGAFNVDTEKMASAFKFEMDEAEMRRLFQTLSTTTVENADTNLLSLCYQDLEEPTMISFYFKDFDSKELFLDFIDEYNEMIEKEDEEKVLNYTDITGLLMSSVKTIVDSVSYVLIAFVSISLIVSSIMIGIITYISVLERTKEIGVLRAIGASKKNISSIFNAETFIVGLFSGIMGIATTLLLLIPINAIIHSVNEDITAILPTVGGTILVILSVILTLIGGLIPSKQAAKKDPVLALRSE